MHAATLLQRAGVAFDVEHVAAVAAALPLIERDLADWLMTQRQLPSDRCAQLIRSGLCRPLGG